MRSYLEYHGSRHGKPPDSGSRNRHTGLSRSDQLVLCGTYGGLHAVPQHAERRFLFALRVAACYLGHNLPVIGSAGWCHMRAGCS